MKRSLKSRINEHKNNKKIEFLYLNIKRILTTSLIGKSKKY